MKFMRFLAFFLVLIPGVSALAATNDFQNASKLLVAARRGDIQTVQLLINSGVDVNYVDSTGLSLVCTAVMNNDTRAIQVLQMYGADASQCDRQIKKYQQKTRVAYQGEDYGFFSGLSSSHVILLSAVGVAAVIGAVVWLPKLLDDDNGGNSSGHGGGGHGGGGGGGGSTVAKDFTVPYGPAYIDPITGNVNTSFDLSANLQTWDLTNDTTPRSLRQNDFYYMSNNGIAGGFMENYLLTMGGYYAFASGYMGQNTFRDNDTHAPVAAAIDGAQGRPVRVALITGNGVNPVGSAASADGITYAVSTALDSSTPHVDKYLNNSMTSASDNTLNENPGFDFSGSGTVFNPFASDDETALAKIVAGWEGDRSADDGDLYGFVSNGQLAIYRTGNGKVWTDVENATSGDSAGAFVDADNSGGLSTGDTVTIGDYTYTIADMDSVTDPVVIVNGTVFKVADNTKMFLAECNMGSGCTTNIAIYVGGDGYWYVNNSGKNGVDAVYTVSNGVIYVQKTQTDNAGYYNFTAINKAKEQTYTVSGDPSAASPVDVIANTNIIPTSRTNSYVTVNTFKKAMQWGTTDPDEMTFYSNLITSYYGNYSGNNQGAVANNLFLGYSSNLPMLVMPAGEYVFIDSEGNMNFTTLDATFENYAPMLYSGLKHNFMTVVGVLHTSGTSSATTISGYGDGTGAEYGKLQLSLWADTDSVTGETTTYASRMCGLAGVGNASGGIDPWCFAASGPTAEMATASAAGAVASVKSAFSYMTNDQVFTLLALTADGPYLAANTAGKVFTTDTLRKYLDDMYQLPLEYDASSLSDTEYLDLFKTVFGYGLINVRRAITPSFSVYYYDGTTNSIVSTKGTANKFWGNVSTDGGSTSRASSVLSLTNRGAIKTSFYDVLESADGSISLPRVWNTNFADNTNSKHGLYMGDVLSDFSVNSKNKRTTQVGNFTFNMAMSERAYDDGMHGLDDLHVTFRNEKYDIDAEFQHYLTDGESRFDGRANGLLSLVSNSVATGAKYKMGNFSFGGRAFSGTITDENLLENDPVVSSQFEPARLGFANGIAIDTGYNTNKFGFNVSFGDLIEDNTVLGMYSDGILTMRGGDTKYVDVIATYKPFDNVKLSARGTFANTHVGTVGGVINDVSDIKSNAFAIGADLGGFSFTAAMPLATVDGKMGYSYAEFEVVENNGEYEVAMNNPHIEYIDLAKQNREFRFSSSYKHSIGEFTDAGIGFIYRVNPNNTNAFGNESVFMFKLHHRLGI
jgi:hypothetical protein